MDIHDKIHTLRREQHKTLEDIATVVGVSKSTVRKWEAGDIKNMRRDKIAKLAYALNVSPEYLMGWSDSAPPPALSPDEELLLGYFRSLSDDGKKVVLQVAQAQTFISSEKNNDAAVAALDE